MKGVSLEMGIPQMSLLRRASSVLRPSAVFTRQISMDTQNLLARLNSAGLLRSQCLIGGKWTEAYGGKTIPVHNPATGDVLVNVPCMGGQETNDAISVAYEAFIPLQDNSHSNVLLDRSVPVVAWSKLTAAERSKRLRKWYDLLMANKEELGQLNYNP